MKRRWKILLGAAGALTALAAVPILYIEIGCSSDAPPAEARKALIQDKAWQREEARTWLTYPEWHIVYSADSFGRFLAKNPPSGYSYLRDIRGFWSSYCAVNQASAASGGADGGTRVMLYTIGLSFSAELLVKGAYENTIGRIFEWIGGWNSADDRYAAKVQRRYGAFMHETPWYEFPFGQAFRGLWATSEPKYPVRHWERRIALSGEYGVKTGYAKLIGAASGASLGRDERMLRFIAQARPGQLERIDRRFLSVGKVGSNGVLVEAPRYAQFTELLMKLSRSPVQLTEISGNDDIFVTALVPAKTKPRKGSAQIMAMPLADRPGWQRIGVSTKVPALLPLIRSIRASGGEIEHVYD
ncbi:MAG: hypothetical protein HOP96_07010 [Sphingomonas sp.]|nr:hypothetical protein [Sphingomonas sp.]